MYLLGYIILSTLVVSLISFIGIFLLGINERVFKKILLVLVALSAGALMGGALMHFIPQALDNLPVLNVFLYVLGGFGLFLLIEKVIHWRHCHDVECKVHTFAKMNLFGDSIHNFIDGLIIAIAFLTSPEIGLITTLIVIAHEVPQEIGDFGVLVQGGYKRSKALFLNFLVSLTSVIGGILGYFIGIQITGFVNFLLPFAAGGFIYIGASDLIPELRKETKIREFFIVFIVFSLSAGMMAAVKFLGI